MNIKRIIQEELDSFDWVNDISAIPEGRFAITFCDYDLSEDEGGTIKKVIDRLEGHFDSVYPGVFNSASIYTSLFEVMSNEGNGTYGFMIYVSSFMKDGKDVGHIGWDDCDLYDDSYDTIYTHEEFMNL